MSRFSKSVLESLESRVLLSAGDLDPSFNGGKLLTTQFSAGSSTMMDVAVLGDGGTVAAGHVANTDGTGFTSYQVALAKYHFDGTLDPSFGIGGEIVATPRGMTKAQEVQVGSDGSLLVFGQNAAGDCLIIKFSSSGKVDTTFAKSGALRWITPGDTRVHPRFVRSNAGLGIGDDFTSGQSRRRGRCASPLYIVRRSRP